MAKLTGGEAPGMAPACVAAALARHRYGDCHALTSVWSCLQLPGRGVGWGGSGATDPRATLTRHCSDHTRAVCTPCTHMASMPAWCLGLVRYCILQYGRAQNLFPCDTIEHPVLLNATVFLVRTLKLSFVYNVRYYVPSCGPWMGLLSEMLLRMPGLCLSTGCQLQRGYLLSTSQLT